MTRERDESGRFTRELTREVADDVAARLLADSKLTLLGACIDAGANYQALKRAVTRFCAGEGITDELAEIVAPVVRAREEQCSKLIGAAEELAADGKSATFYSWWLEKKHPSEYGRVQRTELTGADGGPVEVKDLSAVPHDELIKLALETTKGDG